MRRFFKQFSFPGADPAATSRRRRPGSIHEGGELGYSLAHAYGAVFDNPDLIVACVVGDGEAETGPLATALALEQVPQPAARRRGAADPAPQRLQDRQPDRARADLRRRSSSSSCAATATRRTSSRATTPTMMHRQLARDAGRPRCGEIREIQRAPARGRCAERPRWPMIVLRTPKGWTGPKEVDGKPGRGHPGARTRCRVGGMHDESRAPASARGLDAQLPARGAVRRRRRADARSSRRWRPRVSGAWAPTRTPTAALLLQDLQTARLPRLRGRRSSNPAPSASRATSVLGRFLRDVMRLNPRTTSACSGPTRPPPTACRTCSRSRDKAWMADRSGRRRRRTSRATAG